jgi:hypothetical protein
MHALLCYLWTSTWLVLSLLGSAMVWLGHCEVGPGVDGMAAGWLVPFIGCRRGSCICVFQQAGWLTDWCTEHVGSHL